jgi:4-amino-4-deoxy-L-arabinose transferase-like glycosyltransferase
MTIPRRQQLALMIFAVAVIARLGFVAVHGSIATPDTSGYQLLARNLLRFHAFSASEAPPLQSAISRPPVYPLFLALLLAAGHYAIVPAVVQAILDALVCVMIFLMASRVARRPFAVAVSLLYALHPGAVTNSATLLSDSLFTTLLCIAVFLALIAAERLSSRLAFCSGLVFGLATLCRSIGVLILIAVVCVLIVRRSAGPLSHSSWAPSS